MIKELYNYKDIFKKLETIYKLQDMTMEFKINSIDYDLDNFFNYVKKNYCKTTCLIYIIKNYDLIFNEVQKSIFINYNQKYLSINIFDGYIFSNNTEKFVKDNNLQIENNCDIIITNKHDFDLIMKYFFNIKEE